MQTFDVQTLRSECRADNRFLKKAVLRSSEQPLRDDPLLGRGRTTQDPCRGLITDEGAIVIPLDLRGSGFWLTGLLGDPASTLTTAEGASRFPANSGGTVSAAMLTGGGYRHEWSSGGDEVSSYTFEIGHPKLITPVFFRHLRVGMESVGFETGQEGPANGMVQLVARGEETATATRNWCNSPGATVNGGQ